MRISNSCYVLYGLTTIPPWMVNAGFITGDGITLVVDCGYNYMSAQTIFGYASAASPKNDIVALNTEPHSDHMGGNCFFRGKNIDIYGHHLIKRNKREHVEIKSGYNNSITNPVRKALHEEDQVFIKTHLENPNILVSEDRLIDLCRLEVHILLTPGHSPMNVSVFVPEEKVLYCGDLIVTGYVPNLAEGTTKDWSDWLVSLKKLEALDPEIIVPGHGEVIQGDRIGDELNRIRSFLNEAIESGVPPAP